MPSKKIGALKPNKVKGSNEVNINNTLTKIKNEYRTTKNIIECGKLL